ncbi:MAG TPA: amidohydrolase family protein, partial [Anaerovoracaceae bacterium]|nr:amidohydrolase family protein [Anaerovoracaceae bacterium]
GYVMKKRLAVSILLITALVFGSFGFSFGANSYTVQAGDVLWKIAEQFGTTYQDLAEYNQIKNPHLIYVDQVIKIPDSSAAAPEIPPASPADPPAGEPAPAPAPQTAADTILENGVIYTIDGKNTVAEAIAVKGDKILYVGSDTGAAAYTGIATQVVDLKGKTVMPGFIDGHVHAPGTALTELYDIYLYDSLTKDATLASIKEFVDANPDLDVYWGSGYSLGISDDPKGPKKEWLDEICADKPIILTSLDGHNRWLNSKALEMNGITKDTPNPAGGLVHKDPVTGEPWGNLTDASSLLTMAQTYSPEQEAEAIKYFQESMNGWGYTSIMSIAPIDVDPARYEELEDQDKLTMRVNLAGLIDNDTPFEPQLQAVVDMKKKYESDLIDVTTTKYFADGVVEGTTAYLLEPYAPEAGLDPDYRGEFYWDPDELDQYFDKTMKAGFQIHVHSIGDASTRLVLDSFEYAQEHNPSIKARNAITHLQVVDDADKPRFGKLGVIAVMQPYWHFKEPEWYEYVDGVVLGEERGWKEYPAKSLLDNGAVLTSSGDHPVTSVNNPFWAIEADVTRNLENAEYYGVDDITDIDDPTWLLNPAERLTVLDMVKAYTINGAYQLFREDTVGSLESGKFADLIVVDQDIFKINPLDIDKTQVLTTVFSGEVVSGDYNY